MKTLKIASIITSVSLLSSPALILIVNFFNHEAAMNFGSTVLKALFLFSL